MESLGSKIRRQRRRLGLTLDELAGRTSISKPYLSLIETGRVTNPPSDEKLSKLEQSLGFKTGELLSQAHLQRTPRDVRAMIAGLLRSRDGNAGDEIRHGVSDGVDTAIAVGLEGRLRVAGEKDSVSSGGTPSLLTRAGHSTSGQLSSAKALRGSNVKSTIVSSESEAKSKAGEADGSSYPRLVLDDAYMSGVLRELVERTAGNVDPVPINAVPIINKVSAGYPKDFTDLSYPKGSADAWMSCPDVEDKDAFAARVHGDSMTPKYRQGDVVIFSPKATIRHGDDCFVRFEDGQTTFKRVFFESDDQGQGILRLQPRNEKYRPQVVASEKITGVYRAVFKYQSIDDD